MLFPKGFALLNWITLDRVASQVEFHLRAMFVNLDQVHVPPVETLENPPLFLRLLSEHRVSRNFAPSIFLYTLQNVLDVASAQEDKDTDLHHLLYVASGGTK